MTKGERKRLWAAYLAERNERNLEVLIESYRPTVRYLAYEMYGRTPIDQDDLISEGMIGVWNGVVKLDPKKAKNPDAWVYMCAKGKMINFARLAQHRSSGLPLEDWAHPIHTPDLDLSMSIRQALRELPEREAGVVVKRQLLDRPMAEVAKDLGCSIPNVHYIEQRAFKALQVVLAERS